MEDINEKPIPFKDWYKEKLKVTRYPVLNEIKEPNGIYKDVQVFINVSDEYWMEYSNKFWESGKQNHWFPLGENAKDMGLNSIFGALQVMYLSFIRNYSTLIHCHAGINRSQTVKACFHYMMTGEHSPEDETKNINMLKHNADKHLPSISKMEAWLKACKEAFDNPDKFLGGMYDWTLIESKIIEE